VKAEVEDVAHLARNLGHIPDCLPVRSFGIDLPLFDANPAQAIDTPQVLVALEQLNLTDQHGRQRLVVLVGQLDEVSIGPLD
jgi:hypothetical protein